MGKTPTFTSGAAAQIGAFVRNRAAADAICGSSLDNLHFFDAHCARMFPGESALTQEMVDSWCERRPTERAGSCRDRCLVVVALVEFLRERGETDIEPPDLPRPGGRPYVPHAFTDEELDAFFRIADSLELTERMDKATRTRTVLTVPVVFRLLYSSGIRTCEARLLRRERVDLERGVLHIAEGKGKSERLVALHPSMASVMREYDEAMEALWPGRAYFFPNGPEGEISRQLLASWFRQIWSQVSDERATAYELRNADLSETPTFAKNLRRRPCAVRKGRGFRLAPIAARPVRGRPVGPRQHLEHVGLGHVGQGRAAERLDPREESRYCSTARCARLLAGCRTARLVGVEGGGEPLAEGVARPALGVPDGLRDPRKDAFLVELPGDPERDPHVRSRPVARPAGGPLQHVVSAAQRRRVPEQPVERQPHPLHGAPGVAHFPHVGHEDLPLCRAS